MNYDVWGASSTPGPNAPLSNACGDSQQPYANARSSIQSWTDANMPAEKLVLGLPAYGYVSWSGANKLINKRDSAIEAPAAPRYTRRSEWWQAAAQEGRERRARNAKRSAEPTSASASASASSASNSLFPVFSQVGSSSGSASASASPSASASASSAESIRAKVVADAFRDYNTFDHLNDDDTGLSVKASNGDVSSYAESQIPWDVLVSHGALELADNGTYVGANGFTRDWDVCSNTPYLYSNNRWQVITYDDPASTRIKARYARGQQIGGFAFWDMSSDRDYTLMDAARGGFNIS